MAERRVLVGYLGDRPAVGLEPDTRQRPGGSAGIPSQEEGLDRLVGERPQVVTLGVPAQRMPSDGVVHPLKLDIGRLDHPLRHRAAERAHRRDQAAALLRVAHPDEPDGGQAVSADRCCERGLPGRLGQHVPPPAKRWLRLIEREREFGDERLGPHGMQPELELGDHAEVPAATAQAPEQVLVFGLAGPD